MAILPLLLLASIPVVSSAAVDSIYLHAGEVLIVADGAPRTVTSTGGNALDAALSPDGRWLAYEEALHWVRGSGIFEEDEERGVDAIGALVVMERASGRTVARLEPAEYWIVLDRWLDAERLLFHAAGAFDVSAFFTFDVATRALRQLDYVEGSELLRAERQRRRPLHRGPPPFLVVAYEPMWVDGWRHDSGVAVAPVMAYPATPGGGPADTEGEPPCYRDPELWPCRLAARDTPEQERLRMVSDSLERLGLGAGGELWVLTPAGVVELGVGAPRYGRGTCGVPEGIALGFDGARAGELPPGSYYGTADRTEALRWAARSVRPPAEPAQPAWLDTVLVAHLADVEAQVRDYFEPAADTVRRGEMRTWVVPFRTAAGPRWAVSVFYDEWVPFRAGAVYDAAGRRVEERATGWTDALDLDGDTLHDAFVGERTLEVVRGGAPWRAVEPGGSIC
ncbi:MAG TPA: hypothetical protein VMK65_04095 [Longimicrobiales bacterium]|nr:hypothetical protein [Longimicrobiales bacterium]